MQGWRLTQRTWRNTIGHAGAALRRLFQRFVRARRARSPLSTFYEDERRMALRVVWEIGAEFSEAGCGRRDLDALRLLCLNLRCGQRMGPRVALRVGRLLPAVLSSSVDRIVGMVEAGRMLPVDTHTLLEMESAVEALLSQLQGVSCREGEPLSLDPVAVVGAVDRILRACQDVRCELAPLVTCEFAETARRVALRHHAPRLATGELLIDVSHASRLAVAVEPSDLSQCLEALLAALFASGTPLSPVRLSARPADGALLVSLAWAADGRTRLDPSTLTGPLRVLAAYGVHHALAQNPDYRSRELSAWFPMKFGDGLRIAPSVIKTSSTLVRAIGKPSPNLS